MTEEKDLNLHEGDKISTVVGAGQSEAAVNFVIARVEPKTVLASVGGVALTQQTYVLVPKSSKQS